MFENAITEPDSLRSVTQTFITFIFNNNGCYAHEAFVYGNMLNFVTLSVLVLAKYRCVVERSEF